MELEQKLDNLQKTANRLEMELDSIYRELEAIKKMLKEL